MKNFLTITFLFIAGLAFAQPVRTTITDDGVNVTVQTPVNIKVIPICDFHWVFVDGQLKMWIEGGNELIPGGRLGNFTVNGATTQASKLAALGAISDQCSTGAVASSGLDSIYYGTELLQSGDTIPKDNRAYRVYVAIVTQSGTSAPVAVVLENTLGGTPVWSYNQVGWYNFNFAGITQDSTIVLYGNIGGQAAGDPYTISHYTDVGTIAFYSFYLGSYRDGDFIKVPIEIRLYND